MDKQKLIIFGITGNFATDQRMQRICSATQDLGYEVQLFHRPHFKYKAKELKTGPYSFSITPVRTLFKSGILFYLSYNLILFFRLLFRKADAYYAVDSDTLLAFTSLAVIRRKPLIYDAHEYFSEVPELKGKAFKKWIWDAITCWGVKISAVRITVASQLALEMGKRYGKSFDVIRNVPVSSVQTNSKDLSKPTLIYQGALNEGRCLEMLISAMKELPEMDALIVGEGDLSRVLRDAANGMKNVRFAGLLTPEELREITTSCFAGYNLLDDEGSLSYHFSLSNKYFDYMHAGVPSISSKLPEYLALNEETACGYCIENSPQALIQTLKNCLNDPESYQKMKENAIIASKRFNWETEKLVLIQVFNRI